MGMGYKDIFFLIGGLGLFLYGMNLMGDGFQKSAGEKLKQILEVSASNRFLEILIGTSVTSIMQSSSATTVMIVGFVNAGLINLAQAAGVIMGANIGTTVTAQLLSLNLTDIAYLILGVGVAVTLFFKKKKTKYIGEVLLGFGILFVGMDIMSKSMIPLKEIFSFQNFMASLASHPAYSLLVGLVATAIIQSSIAMTGIMLALAMSGQMSFAAALPMIFGANLGTCVTALLASIGTHKNARRAALIHLLFNILGTIIFLPFIPYLREWIPAISGDSVSRQIVNVHTIFNITNTLIMVWFIPLLVRLVKWLLPGEDKEEGLMTLEYLDRRLLETPYAAIGQLVKEVVRMGRVASENFTTSYEAFIKQDSGLVAKVAEQEGLVNYLEREITAYMVELSNTSLSEHQSEVVTSLFHVVNDIERIGDHADNLSELAEYRINSKIPFSDHAIVELKYMYETVKSAVTNSLYALESFDTSSAERALEIEDRIDKLEKQLRGDHIERLNRGICFPASGAIFLDVITNLERIGDHSTNIAEMVLATK